MGNPGDIDPSRPIARTSLARALYLSAGVLLLVLGGIGVVVPLLPTTPFVLAAAACFARSSPTLHQSLLENRVFGPLIIDWNEHRVIRRGAKIASTTVNVVFGAIAIYIAPFWWVKVLLIATFASVLTWLWTRPETPALAPVPPDDGTHHQETN